MEQAVIDIKVELGERHACKRMGVARASFQRQQLRSLVTAEGTSPHCDVTFVAVENVRSESAPSRQVRREAMRQLKTCQRSCPRALTLLQRQALLDAVHQDRFVDRSVPYIYATLLDENLYYGSISTMYRVLRSVGEVGERRDQATRPAHIKPELCAKAPNQVYAWDITKLHGPQKWTYLYLYAVIDIYSRYVVGWLLAERESSELAKLLLESTIR